MFVFWSNAEKTGEDTGPRIILPLMYYGHVVMMAEEKAWDADDFSGDFGQVYRHVTADGVKVAEYSKLCWSELELVGSLVVDFQPVISVPYLNWQTPDQRLNDEAEIRMDYFTYNY